MSFAWKNLETCLTGLSHLTKNKQNMQIRWKPFILARSCGNIKKQRYRLRGTDFLISVFTCKFSRGSSLTFATIKIQVQFFSSVNIFKEEKNEEKWKLSLEQDFELLFRCKKCWCLWEQRKQWRNAKFRLKFHRSDEGLTLETSTLYCGQLTLSTQLITLN